MTTTRQQIQGAVRTLERIEEQWSEALARLQKIEDAAAFQQAARLELATMDNALGRQLMNARLDLDRIEQEAPASLDHCYILPCDAYWQAMGILRQMLKAREYEHDEVASCLEAVIGILEREQREPGEYRRAA